jgi:hypothetical protein
MGKRVPAWTSASPLFEHQSSSIDIEVVQVDEVDQVDQVDQVVPMVSEVLESLRRALSTPLALWADIKERRGGRKCFVGTRGSGIVVILWVLRTGWK